MYIEPEGIGNLPSNMGRKMYFLVELLPVHDAEKVEIPA